MTDQNDDLGQWLNRHGIADLAPVLEAEDVDLEVLAGLTEVDLRELGLSLGRRKKLLKAIETLNTDGGSSLPSEPVSEPAETVREAERRQLTVMFCDVIDSTALSERLDPEDLRDVMLAYQEVCVEAIQSCGGHPAKYLGDGILAYFGYPQAHEDDAARSVRAGLALLRAIKQLNSNLEARMGLTIGVRIGIHTGLVVAGEMGGGDVKESEAIVGETPNIAARLEGLAERGGMVIGPLTRSLIGEAFVCRFLGEKMVKGISTPIPVHAVEKEQAASDAPAFGAAVREEPLVGRDSETATLTALWSRAREGSGQLAVITGEAGVGKSRMAREIARMVAAEGHPAAWLQGSPFHSSSPLHPVITGLARLIGLDGQGPPDERLSTLEAWLDVLGAEVERDAPLLGALFLLPVEGRYGAQTAGPQLRKRLTLEVLVRLIQRMALREPLLLVVEDAHWLDPTTLEWLTLIVDGLKTTALTVLITARPEFENPWRGKAGVHDLPVERMDSMAGAGLIQAVTKGKRLPDSVIEQILDKADGIPEEYVLSQTVGLAIPATLQDLLTARLDQLGSGKEAAQIGSAIGRRFAHAMVVPLSTLGSSKVNDALRRLTESDLVDISGSLPDASYVFRHALIRDAAYDSMLKSRRQPLNGRIADLIERDFPEVATSEPEVVARHRTAAEQHAAAVVHWRSAARRALSRGANVEAIAHLHQALACLSKEAETDDAKRAELELQCMLGPALMATRGWGAPEPHAAFNRARTLCDMVGDRRQTFAALWGIWLFHAARADLPNGLALVGELFAIAEAEADEELELQAHHAAWGTRCWFGDMEVAVAHVERGLELYDPERHRSHAMRYGGHDPGVCARVQGALTIWYRGYPDRALKNAEEGLSLAYTLKHPPSVGHALLWLCNLHCQRRDRQRTAEAAASLTELAKQQALGQYIAQAATFAIWAAAPEAGTQATIAAFREAIAGAESVGHKGLIIMQRLMLAETLIEAGLLEEAAIEVSSDLSLIAGPEPHVCASDLHRLEGEIARARPRPDPVAAEISFRQAIQVAKQQKARSFELRAVTSLAYHLRDEGRAKEAAEELALILDWFTEGFQTEDLINAVSLRRDLT
jgi:class 3 adenylate cyclase/predicted ATPase